ncbi:hypothetical protein TTHERM_001277491 (macronuclear) [Tetrahymena thermophila SB210]|uniref:Uncharacterized protein n=1 Tax=Tetrahymena thermophila (strain SB210) TaxID=312017 RepID=W7XI01_TETTS|nr:hypothetical protein TTHERM_001277491 [Tetrahymena thermophila SB210]EWS72854.1 hypothetical protein TTHERM_001277491 [Tetrahymena thermophila SB210]|eukprot:XP_012654608.1 hypothetical protein TTHERM_001277491 [Tetrahymena thermophila SB210]
MAFQFTRYKSRYKIKQKLRIKQLQIKSLKLKKQMINSLALQILTIKILKKTFKLQIIFKLYDQEKKYKQKQQNQQLNIMQFRQNKCIFYQINNQILNKSKDRKNKIITRQIQNNSNQKKYFCFKKFILFQIYNYKSKRLFSIQLIFIILLFKLCKINENYRLRKQIQVIITQGNQLIYYIFNKYQNVNNNQNLQEYIQKNNQSQHFTYFSKLKL